MQLTVTATVVTVLRTGQEGPGPCGCWGERAGRRGAVFCVLGGKDFVWRERASGPCGEEHSSLREWPVLS